MNREFQHIMEELERHNSSDMAGTVFGFDTDTVYDALVFAPGWKPEKLCCEDRFQITSLTQHSYISSFLLEREGVKIAWVQCASGASNLIDHMLICGRMQFKSLLFVGAVGSLVPEIGLGALCIPSRCIEGVGANAYLCPSLRDFVPFGEVLPDAEYTERIVSKAAGLGYSLRKASVFCTDSISMEYSHLDEIRAFKTELIEMETSSFYRVAALWEKNAAALLVVSDNSATGTALVGRSEEEDRLYDQSRKQVIPELIYQIAGDPAL